MDFLISALYSHDDQSEEKLSGVLLTHFDEGDLTSRAHVYYASVEQLRSNNQIQPTGFKLESDGVLLSDTQARISMSPSVTDYIAYELGSALNRTPQGLLDVVLYAAKYGGRVFVNAKEFLVDRQNVKPIMVSMLNFKVSNSSFNIYAPYKRDDETFRTISLIDIETDETIPFILAIPVGESGNYAAVSTLLEPVFDFEEFTEFKFFRVNAPMLPFYTLTGEGFLNYLSYNVASCKLGLRVIDEFLGETGYIAESGKEKEEKREVREIKKPQHNVAIECPFTHPHTRIVLECLQRDDMERLKELMKDEEVYLTFIWLKHIFTSSERFSTGAVEDKTAAACAIIKRDVKMYLLHYSVELLAQRLYLQSLGMIQTPYGPVLKGGGVNGSSTLKHATW